MPEMVTMHKAFIAPLLFGWMVLWCSPLWAQPDIEEVYLFPERYAGQTLTFNAALLHGDIRRQDGHFLLDVRSRDGKDVSPVLSIRDGMAFLVSPSMAEAILKDKIFRLTYWIAVRLTCRMEQVRVQLGYLAWACNVSSIGILNHRSEVTRTLPPTPTQTVPPKPNQPTREHLAAPAPSKQRTEAPQAKPDEESKAQPQTKQDHTWVARDLWTVLANHRDRYPASGHEGRVVMKLTIDQAGNVLNVAVAQSSGHPDLDEHAAQRLKRISPIPLTRKLDRQQIHITLPFLYRHETD